MNKVLTGNSLDVLKTLEDNSVDSVVTDPPYGYSFMGKDWDKAVPSVEIWQECLRVLKPGAFCMVMSAPRSDVQMHMISNLEQAGFRIDFTPIYWTYASGFPKAGNIGKMVDKRLGESRESSPTITTHIYGSNRPEGTHKVGGIPSIANTDQAKALDGSYAGFQPKPAVEVIIVAMKPLSEKTFVDQALKNGKGITWLDDVRIPYDGMADAKDAGEHSSHKPGETVYQTGLKPRGNDRQGTQGRFPANLLVSDDVLNDGTIQKSSYALRKNTGISGSVFNQANKGLTDNLGYADSGSYSRYFDLDKWANTLPFLITPKASKREKNEGLEQLDDKPIPGADTKNSYMGVESAGVRATHGKNVHPTVKPLKLMSYLITLTTREGDTVLDPFCGSGTTCIAAKMLKRDYIGIEREAEYVEIAEARLKAHEPELTLL